MDGWVDEWMAGQVDWCVESTWDFESDGAGTEAWLCLSLLLLHVAQSYSRAGHDTTSSIAKSLSKQNAPLFHGAHILFSSLQTVFWGILQFSMVAANPGPVFLPPQTSSVAAAFYLP